MGRKLHKKQIWDLNSGFFGVPVKMLMEEAGKQIALSCIEKKEPFLVVVGPGNNGGDGLVCARYLHELGKEVYVVLTKHPDRITSILWLDNFTSLRGEFPSERFLDKLPDNLGDQ